MPLAPLDLVVHTPNPRTGWPLCWHPEEIGMFEVAWFEDEVDCEDCKLILGD
jgi:hypothetical protein